MRIIDMMACEIRFRKWSFLLGVLSLVIAVGGFVACWSLLDAHDTETGSILAQQAAALGDDLASLRENMRRHMLHLGFDVAILPMGQNLGDWLAEDYATETMPEEYSRKLAASELVTIQHVVPRLRQRIKWREAGWTAIVVGTGTQAGHATLDSAGMRVEHVRPGTVWVGHEIHRSRQLTEGGKLAVQGRTFTIAKCLEERGTSDDITLWLELGDAQDLLAKPEQINEIVALECRSSLRKIENIREEIAAILPDTRVVQRSPEVTAKLEAISHVEAEGEAAIAEARQERVGLRQARKAVSIPIVALLATLTSGWIGLNALADVRRRRAEIGILRAVGFTSGQLIALLFSRILLLAVVGGTGGYLVGIWLAPGAVAALSGGSTLCLTSSGAKLAAALGMAVGVAGVATAGPVVCALRRDPADSLRGA